MGGFTKELYQTSYTYEDIRGQNNNLSAIDDVNVKAPPNNNELYIYLTMRPRDIASQA